MKDTDEDPKPPSQQQWWQESMREFAPYVGLGIQLAAAVLLFFFLGWWADVSWDTEPWGRLVGVLVGSVGGMIKFIRTVTGPAFGSRPNDGVRK